jgi:hypothetical protein
MVAKRIRREGVKKPNKLFDYFKFEQSGDKATIHGNFSDNDFGNWLQMIHGFIQKILSDKLFDGFKIKNYLSMTLYLGGQRVDIAIVKDGGKGPDELYKELLNKEAERGTNSLQG